jgi:hypothetical protein
MSCICVTGLDCGCRITKFGKTNNEVDFTKIVKRKQSYHGVAVIPSGGSRDEHFQYLMAIADFLRATPPAMDGLKNRIVSVDENKTVSTRLAYAGAPTARQRRQHQERHRKSLFYIRENAQSDPKAAP